MAEEAEVGLQTLLRAYGTKDELFQATALRALEAADGGRAARPGSTWRDSVTLLWDYYEEHGRLILHYLNQRDRQTALVPVTTDGWARHRDWLTVLFGRWARLGPGLDLLLDVRSWEALRLRQGLPRPQAQRELEALLAPFLTSPGT